MSKYTIAGKVVGVTINGGLYHIELFPSRDYRTTQVGGRTTNMVLFRPVKNDGRAEISFCSKTIEIEVSIQNKHTAAFYANWKRKATWKFEFGPSKRFGDGMIWVCGLSAIGALIRKPLNKNNNGLKFTSIT